MKKRFFVIFAMLLLLLLAACSGNKGTPDSDPGLQPGDDGEEIVITGKDLEEKVITVAEIRQLDSVTRDVVSVDSGGNEDKYQVKGALFADVLELIGKKQQDLNGIRLIAGDGYMIEVPQEILAAREIILAYEIDGKPLEDKTKPIRVVIPEERAMYWIRNLVKVEILEAREQQSLTKLFLLESAVSALETQDYTYYDAVDQAIICSDLSLPAAETVYLKSTDDFEKNEKFEVFAQGYLKISGAEAPAFVAPDLPKGMHVKDILYLTSEDVGYFSVTKGLEYFTSASFDDITGIAVSDLLNEVAMAAGSKYLFTATDGYSVEIEAADLEKGVIYVNNDEVTVAFEGLPKNTRVKGLLSIEVLGAGTVEAGVDEATVDWSITVEGIGENTVAFTSADAAKLSMRQVTAVLSKKDGTQETQNWEGVSLKDVLDMLGATDYQSVIVEAADGYAQEYSLELIGREETILGLKLAGQPLDENNGPVQAVPTGEPGNMWIKNVAKLIVK
ncbi:MAG: molybdopterin-dependent oxidoreductase [Firmicutes bacterium]|nr:molybdopterin-dependent oxidoreductase [Bacillota bacterium]